MQNTRKRLFQGLLFCSPLSILSLQAAPTAISLPELGALLRRPDLEESLSLPAYQACSKPVQTRKQHGRNAANQQLGALTSQWLNQFGQAAVIFNDRLSESTLQTGRLALLLPLYEQSQQLLLTQWGVLRDHQQTTLNVGVGQRCFNQAQGYWGYHVFYDYRRQGNHGRLGLGLEQRSAAHSVAVNGYLPVSGWRIAEDQTTQSRPAKGMDLRLQQQLPQHPQLQLTAVLEHYFARSLAPEDAQQPPPRPTAFTLGLDYTPLPLLTTSYAYQLASGGQRNHQLQLTLIYRLGVPLLQQLDPTQVAQAQSLAGSRYALIQRHSQIVLEQRAYEPPAKADQAQAPQDTLQIELPNEQQQGEPGKSLTVPIKLSSSCALNAWQFTGEGDFITQGGTPKVDFEQQQLILTLPDQPGEYSLEIVASKAQGVTTRSNTLRVRVQAEPEKPTAPMPPSPTRDAAAHKQATDLTAGNESTPVPVTRSGINNNSPAEGGPASGGADAALKIVTRSGSTDEEAEKTVLNEGKDNATKLLEFPPKNQRRNSVLSQDGSVQDSVLKSAINVNDLASIDACKNNLFRNRSQPISHNNAILIVGIVKDRNERNNPINNETEFRKLFKDIISDKSLDDIIKNSNLTYDQNEDANPGTSAPINQSPTSNSDQENILPSSQASNTVTSTSGNNGYSENMKKLSFRTDQSKISNRTSTAESLVSPGTTVPQKASFLS